MFYKRRKYLDGNLSGKYFVFIFDAYIFY